jgi:hypothetical protein
MRNFHGDQQAIAGKVDELTNKLPTCVICLETILKLKDEGISLKATVCGHILCDTCYTQWKEANRNPSIRLSILCRCPSCRRLIDAEDEVFPLFV